MAADEGLQRVVTVADAGRPWLQRHTALLASQSAETVKSLLSGLWSQVYQPSASPLSAWISCRPQRQRRLKLLSVAIHSARQPVATDGGGEGEGGGRGVGGGSR